jgi:TRAP-type C4-dicarboxylate transport system substrate-binding protein
MLGGLMAAASPATETNVLWLGAPWPPGSKARSDLDAAARAVARQTDGRVQLKIAEQEGLDFAGRSCAGALLAGPQLARLAPSARLLLLPRLFRSSAEAEQVRTRLTPAMAAELAASGLEMLGQPDFGFAYLMARMPLEPGSLAARRLWIPPADDHERRAAAAWGMVTVPLAPGEVREALHAGSLDAVVAPPLGAILLQWHVEVKWLLDAPLVALDSAVVVRREALENLAAADRASGRAELPRAFAAIAADLRSKEAEAVEVLARNGVVRHSLDDGPARAAWEAWADAVADRLAAEGYIHAESLAEVRAVRAEFRGP